MVVFVIVVVAAAATLAAAMVVAVVAVAVGRRPPTGPPPEEQGGWWWRVDRGGPCFIHTRVCVYSAAIPWFWHYGRGSCAGRTTARARTTTQPHPATHKERGGGGARERRTRTTESSGSAGHRSSGGGGTRTAEAGSQHCGDRRLNAAVRKSLWRSSGVGGVVAVLRPVGRCELWRAAPRRRRRRAPVKAVPRATAKARRRPAGPYL